MQRGFPLKCWSKDYKHTKGGKNQLYPLLEHDADHKKKYFKYCFCFQRAKLVLCNHKAQSTERNFEDSLCLSHSHRGAGYAWAQPEQRELRGNDSWEALCSHHPVTLPFTAVCLPHLEPAQQVSPLREQREALTKHHLPNESSLWLFHSC